MNKNLPVREKSTARNMLIAITFSPFFSLMSIGIVNVALPNLAVIFDENITTVQWVSLGYLITIPIVIPVVSKLGTLWGYDRIHNWGISIFAIASVLIVFSPDIFWMSTFRVFQGVGAAMFQATNIAIVTLCYPAESRGKILGLLSTSVAVGSMVGPSVGGILIQWFNWQIMFLVHVPFLLVAAWLAHRNIRIEREKSTEKIDMLGAVQFSLMIATLMTFVSFGGQWGWTSTPIMALSVVFAALLVSVLWRMRKVENSFVNPRLFSNKVVSVGILISFVTYIVSFSIQVSIPFHMQTILDFNPMSAGLLMTAYPILLAFAGPFFGSLSDRFGSLNVILPGLTIMTIAILWMLTIDGSANMLLIAFMLSLLGLGMGMITSPNYSMVMGNVDQSLLGMAGGIVALSRTVGTAIGSAGGLLLMNIWIPSEQGDVASILTQSNEAVKDYALKGFNTIYLTMAILCLLLVLSVWFVTKSKRMSKKLSVVERGE